MEDITPNPNPSNKDSQQNTNRIHDIVPPSSSASKSNVSTSIPIVEPDDIPDSKPELSSQEPSIIQPGDSPSEEPEESIESIDSEASDTSELSTPENNSEPEPTKAEPETIPETGNTSDISETPNDISPEVTASKTTTESVETEAITSSESAETVAAPLVAEPAKSVVTTSAHKKSPKGLILAVVLLILIAAGACAYFFLSHKSTNKTAASTAIVKKDIPNIRYATTNEGWETFYPAINDSSNYFESNIMIFEGLVRFENKTQIVPLLSTGWTNPDSSTWVFNLRSGVKFHNGRVMTADDVKASFDAAKNTDLGQIFGASIKSTTVTAPLQVTIKTDGPDPTLLKKLTGYYVYDTKSGKTNDPVNGTGPFTLKTGTTAKTNSLELTAFDQYWGGRPHVRSFSFVGLDTDDSGKAYADNKANIMEFSSTPSALGTRAHTSQKLDQSSVFVMPLNTLKAGSPLAKLQVRQAILDTIDPVAIAKVRETPAIPATQIIPNSIPGFDPSITRPAKDITKAKELLKEAGYPNGITITLTYFSPSQTTGEEIKKELAEIGVKVTLDPQTEVKTLAAKAYGGGTDAYFNTYSSDIFDGSDALSNFAESPNYSNPTITALLGKASSTLDASKRLGYLQQASKLFATDVGAVPIYTESADEIVYDPSYVIQRDIADNNLGVYFQKVYAK